MVKAVFVHHSGSIYDDVRHERYHFPHVYLRRVQQTVGDSILYYEPKRGGRQAYVGVAFVDGVIPDANRADMFYAKISGFQGFTNDVPYKGPGGFYERRLQQDDGSLNRGLVQHAVRLIELEEYEAILTAGFAGTPEWPLFEDEDKIHVSGLSEVEQSEFERPISEQILRRKFRDREFTRQVQKAYDRKCAITGLRILNGLGRPEVQAAHIKSVADLGPDWVRNGIALSGTVHWMFDRGIISLDDDFRILKLEKAIPSEFRHLINANGLASVPEPDHLRPHPEFLKHHRENIFKG